MIYTNRELPHAWIYQSSNSGRGSNFYFEGERIYSYGRHFLAGEILDFENNVVWINDDYYSPTTAKHQSYIRGAIDYAVWTRFVKSETCRYLVNESFKQAKNTIARARHKEKCFYQVHNLYEAFSTWVKYVKKNRPSKDSGRYWHSMDDELSTWNPAENKKLLNRMKYWLDKNEPNLPGWLEKKRVREEKAAIAREEKRKKIEAANKIKIAEFKDKFYAYQAHSLHIYGVQHLIRVSLDGESVETSLGVKVPIIAAYKLYMAIIKGIDIRGYKIEHYTVRGINGVLSIGCHNIEIESMHRTGKLLRKEFKN